MRPFSERLNEQLERQRRGEPQPAISGSDPAVDELALLAHHLRTTPHLQVDGNFARQLEQRILAHHAVQSGSRAIATRSPRLRQRPRALALVVACLLLLVGMPGILAAAAQVSNPHNPLYEVKRWEQHWQDPQLNSTVAQANADSRSAHNQLHTLTILADQGHEANYQQTLANIDQQIDSVARSIQTLPEGPDKDSLRNQLTTLKADARRTLRALLPNLTLAQQLLTTDELARLNDVVPHIDSVGMVVAQAQKQAAITINGENLQPSAQLFVNGQLIPVSGSLQDGTALFVISWPGDQSPETIGIRNPDGTAAQTTNITFTSTNDNGNGDENDSNTSNGSGNNNGNSSSNGNGNGNSNGNSSNGNGNSNGNSSSSSTGNGNGNSNSSSSSKNNGNNGNGKDKGNSGNGKSKGKSVATPTPTPTP